MRVKPKLCAHPNDTNNADTPLSYAVIRHVQFN
jgi:hypothetical protein